MKGDAHMKVLRVLANFSGIFLCIFAFLCLSGINMDYSNCPWYAVKFLLLLGLGVFITAFSWDPDKYCCMFYSIFYTAILFFLRQFFSFTDLGYASYKLYRKCKSWSNVYRFVQMCWKVRRYQIL